MTMFIDSPTKGQSYVDFRLAQLKIFFEEKKMQNGPHTTQELGRLNDAISTIYFAWSSVTYGQIIVTDFYNQRVYLLDPQYKDILI
ncbi:hypothetical protein DPMN_194012 [Dreissena polymorpha]|uniref:Uncharacterized protein n=1 Tax=Dreissena polymorpha TaxID=45954 RepID=A0A9D4BDQ3_DREPO|nr:hypothetical protein DPMN_194012 [Dreissena polymorpha]